MWFGDYCVCSGIPLSIDLKRKNSVIATVDKEGRRRPYKVLGEPILFRDAIDTL